jgi:hypothetical protein
MQQRAGAVIRGFTMCLASLLCLLGGAAAHAAALGDNTVKLLPSKFRLAQNIGPLRYSGENRYSDRRLGNSFGYNTSGISLTIYIYDYGIRDIPDGPDSVAACEQFESAKREIEYGGNYQNVQLRHELSRRMQDIAGAPLAREASYEFDRNGVHATSMLWLTAADGYFVKLRLSLRGEVADEQEEARAQILDALATSFAARPARPAAPARDEQQESSIAVDAGGDPSDAALWLDYAVELVRASREQPQTRPPCGGPFVPGFAAELAARRAALREYQARAAALRNSSYFEVLARVDAAGFLDEYVWHFLRNESLDHAPPANLRLTEFETFRQHELAAHVVSTGAHVRINAVRVLPLDPAP